MNPIDVANQLRNQYVSYLTTTFGLDEGEGRLAARFRKLVSEPGRLLAGPFLEATAPYAPGERTLESLVTAGLLDGGFRSLLEAPENRPRAATSVEPRRGLGLRKAAPQPLTDGESRRERFPHDRVLYQHQELAIHRLCGDIADHDRVRNTVVASGTGSGKTECFLIPAIDWILRHPTRSENGKVVARGLRVLLVYPMNALVNDQIRRLVQVTGYWRDRGESPIPVTFARYTSETQGTRREGLKHEPNAPDNQLLGRDEIIANPPDILITNFAMLEQALLRPQESPFFEQVDEFAWRYLILDEAHSYRGAQGIELARLMQRMRAAVRRGKRAVGLPARDPICVATSATLAGQNLSGDDRISKTAEFASALFGGVAFDASAVIFAERLDPAADAKLWGFPEAEAEKQADVAWGALSTEALRDLDRPGDDPFWDTFRPLAIPPAWEEARRKAGDDRRAFLYHLLHGHPRFHWLWERVREAPQQFEALAETWTADGADDGSASLGNLVSACNAARRCPGEQPLLPCRYHLFASALEGLFVVLARDQEQTTASGSWDVPELGIQEIAVRRLRPKDRVAFEVSRCRTCLYPFVSIDRCPQTEGLDQPPVWTRPMQFLAFHPDCTDGPPLAAVRVDLRDGRLEPDTAPGGPLWRTLYQVPSSSDLTDVEMCPKCGAKHQHSGVIGRFQTGQDAPVSVLTESLYEQMPGLDDRQQQRLRMDFAHRFHAQDDPLVGEGRKLLIFSDSRQNAAFMASYLQDHAREYLVREIAFDALPRSDRFDLNDWANACLQEIQRRGLQVPFLQDRDLAEIRDSPFRDSYFTSVSDKKNAILYYLLSELVGTQRLVLESLGLLQVERPPELRGIFDLPAAEPIDLPNGWPGPPLAVSDFWQLADRILRLMRRHYLLTVPENVNRPGFGTLQHHLIKQRVPGCDDILHGLYNAASQDTVYVDLLRRWGRKRSGQDASEVQIRGLLSDLFDELCGADYQPLLEQSKQAGFETLALRHSGLRVCRPTRLWQCGTCGAFSSSYLDGVCGEPRCRGTLEPLAPSEFPCARPESHMFTQRFVQGRRAELRCEEHTAQLSSELGQQTQEAFQCGQVNVLSCSTTFEMGIDIGSLQAVVLRNVPPSTINYLQRAGRAGRRSDAVAFVLTFCQRRPHDRLYFTRPHEIIAGDVEPPRIDLANRKILQRHCFAEILTEYWSWLDDQRIGGETGQFRMAGNVGSFFDARLDRTNGTAADYLRQWLAEQETRRRCQERLTDAFLDVPGDELAPFLDLIVNPTPRSGNTLAVAGEDAVSLLRSFREGEERHTDRAGRLGEDARSARRSGDHQREEQLAKERDGELQLARSFSKLLRQQRREFLISFLMGRGVLPSFAFPVNVVKLHVLREEFNPDRPDNAAPRLKFDRDGKIALGEYAPGAEVVAGKRVYRSVGLRKFPALEFDGTNWFRWCNYCNALQVWPQGTERPGDVQPECPTCGEPLTASPMQWVPPRWGFVTDAKEKGREPHGQRPARIQTTRAFFLPQWSSTGAGPSPVAAEQSEMTPDEQASMRVEARYSSGRSLLVLNLGDYVADRHGILRRSGFRLCGQCGRVHFDGKDTPRRHRPPYHRQGTACQGLYAIGANTAGQPVALGHRYETDVLRLEFHGADRTRTDTGFWLSLAYALTNAACRELCIERADLEATTFPLQHADRQAVVIYDAVPGGAGHCRRILHEIPGVVRRAHAILAGCDCDPDSTGCYGCLCDYQNQFAHDQLKRGPVLAYLGELLDVLDAGHPGPWRAPSTAPGREMVDSLQSATHAVTLVSREIRPSMIKGLNRDWFDVLKELAARPCGADKLCVVVASAPRRGQSAEETVAYHRIAELRALGVQVCSIRAGRPQWSSLVIGGNGTAAPIVWRWPWEIPLGPDTDDVRRSRIGRGQQAAEEIDIPADVIPLALPQLREFHEFTLEAGIRHNMFAPALLGKLMRHSMERILVVDPHILHSRRQAEILSQFLQSVRLAEGAQFKIRTGRVRGGPRQGDFALSEQEEAARELGRQRGDCGVAVEFPTDGYFVDHDRLIYMQLRTEAGTRFYKVILGQGLFGFHPACRRRSHGVWFEISASDFDAQWSRQDG